MSPQNRHYAYSRFVIPEEILKENGYLYFETETSKKAEFKKTNQWSIFTFMPDNDNRRKCTRCSTLFNRKSTFSTLCQFHPLKTGTIDGFQRHLCCFEMVGTSRGCTSHPFHVHKQPSESVLEQFVQTPSPVSIMDYRSNKIFALDVEMVHTENGLEAGRASLVDLQGKVIIDEFIQPEGRLVHLNTQFSGIEESHLENAKSLKQIHQLLFQFINRSTLLIGHGLSNDLKVLKLIHMNVIDTALVQNLLDGSSQMPSLKKLAKMWLDVDIQTDEMGHDSVEDARTCLKIVEQFDKLY